MNRFWSASILPFSLALVLCSCDEEEHFEKHVEWETVEFANEGAIYAIQGDLRDYLLLSTISKILRTDDGGKTWNVVANHISPVGDFLPINNDLYAITNDVDYVSRDQGRTWLAVEFDLELVQREQNFSDSKRTLYSAVRHYDGELGLPTTLLRSLDGGDSWEMIFPYKRIFYSWYVDGHDRIYIGTWGAVWDGEFFTDNPKQSAYLYYMK
jgi:photosystem II stability/assembly factor-like uncharacterized protein